MVLITMDKATYLAFFIIVLLALASIIGIITLIITFSIISYICAPFFINFDDIKTEIKTFLTINIFSLICKL